MLLKNFKITLLLLLLALFIMPYTVFAYSDKIIVGGENIGIKLNSKGIIIAGVYKVNDEYPAKNAGLKSGDIITKVNDTPVSTTNDMAKKISEIDSNKIKISFLRDGKEKSATLTLFKDENGVYKTGLYVKDSVTGIGTLTYIDPETKIFGALGHEIADLTTGKALEIKDGSIFSSKVVGIKESTDGIPGEKKAEYDVNKTTGEVSENTTQGVFGTYTASLPNKTTYKVASPKDIKLGKAKIFTVLDGTDINEYEINITEIKNSKEKNKNFVFEITDKNLLDKTNGIVQGMSGSPIIQGDYIIGAVTHVVVANPNKGYGIFITNMLEEGEN